MLDRELYRYLYPDVAELSDDELQAQWNSEGAPADRVGNSAALREALGPDLGPELDRIAPEFSWRQYLAVNPDLNRYGWNGVQALEHYLKHGRSENRPTTLAERARQRGVDLGIVPVDFDPTRYLQLNPDVAAGGFSTPEMATLHFAEHGVGRQHRVYRFDHEFYADFYLEQPPSADGASEAEHWRRIGARRGWFALVEEWLRSINVDVAALPALPDLAEIARLNGLQRFGYRDLRTVIEQNPVRDVRLFQDDEENATALRVLADRAARIGDDELSSLLADRANRYFETPEAHQQMGDSALRLGNKRFAGRCYVEALASGSRSVWPLAHGVRIRLSTGDVDGAMEFATRLVEEHGGDAVAEQALKDLGNGLWANAQDRHRILAGRNDRERLVAEVKESVGQQAEIRRGWIARGAGTTPRSSVRRDKILLVADLGLPQTKRYRVDQKREQLEAAGYQVTIVNWQHLADARAVLPWHDVIIVYRAPAWPKIVRFITDARAAGKVVFYEIDDMIYGPEYPPPIENYGGQITPKQYDDLITGMAAYRAAAQICDYALSSTAPLVESLASLVNSGKGYLHRNGFDSLTPASTRSSSREEHEPLYLFYGSGTKAHNDDFVDLVLPALDKVLQENARARLVTVGYLQLPADFVERHERRLKQLPFTSSVEAYMSLLRAADVNLAVLHPDVLTDGKSELKWFEAANFGIPSVVSDTANYVDVIHDGEDGFLARSTEEWYRCLTTLLEDDRLRRSVGEAARQRVLREYSARALSKNIDRVIQEACDDFEARMGAGQ